MQVEDGKGFLTVHEGGSKKGKLVASMTGKKNEAQVNIPGNQMYIMFHTNGEVATTIFLIRILESK